MESDSAAAKPSGSSIIFINQQCQVLLLLRDDIPSIPYPNQWDLPGGHVEPFETPRECIVREIREEMGMDIEPFYNFRIVEFDDRNDHVFWKSIQIDTADIRLTEGQRLKWFSRDEVAAMRLAYGFNPVVEAFFKTKIWEHEP